MVSMLHYDVTFYDIMWHFWDGFKHRSSVQYVKVISMKIYIMSKLSEMTKSKFRTALHTQIGLSSVNGRPFTDFVTYIT